MLTPRRSGAPPVPLAVVVGAQKLASGSLARARGSNVSPVSSLGPESWWVHGDFDYMHARYCSPVTGRFLATDKHDILAMQFGDEEAREQFRQYVGAPQSWNRYSYTKGNPLKMVDPDGDAAAAVVALPLASGAGAGLGTAVGAAAGATVGATIFAGAAAGALIGTGIRQIPGVDDAVRGGFEKLIDAWYVSQSTKQQVKVLSGVLRQAEAHLDKLASGGDPGKDPDRNHHLGEIKGFLKTALRVAQRLPTKLKNKALQQIQEIAKKAGLEL